MRIIFGLLFLVFGWTITTLFFIQEWRAVVSSYDESIKRHALEGIIGFWVFQGIYTLITGNWVVDIIPLIGVLVVSFGKELYDMARGFSFSLADIRIRLIGSLYGLVIWGIIYESVKFIKEVIQ